jgi:hypothetical protein
MQDEFFEMWEIIAPNELALKCIKFLAERGSHVSSGHEATKLDFFGIYRKK